MPVIRRCGSSIFVAALVALLPVVAGAVDRIASTSATGDAVVWQPQLASYDRLVLTVTGPEGTVTRDFQRGEAPSFPLYDAAGSHLADGGYRWELRLIPSVDAATRQALARDRAAGSTATSDQLRATGALPAVTTDSGYFSIVDGAVVMPGDIDEASAAAAGGITNKAEGTMTPMPGNVVLTNSNGVIRNALCVGLDCPDSPSFSDSSLLLMENNDRIKFDDTSVSPFPANDWELEANSNLSGGPNQFALNDCASSSQGGCATDPVFVVEAGVRANALFVENDGDVGIGTSNPVLDLHIVTGNGPGIRLDQDASGGFAPQVWDIVGNETSFFVRDASHGSALPFRIFPSAPSNSLVVAGGGNVGVGTLSPEAPLHVKRTSASGLMMQLEGNGDVFFRTKNSTSGQFVDVNLVGDEFRINFGTGGTGPELRLTNMGSLIITGTYTPDYVFDAGYELMPIDQLADFVGREKHLPNVPNAA